MTNPRIRSSAYTFPSFRLHAARLLCLLLILVCQGCASVYKPKNQAIAAIDHGGGYRFTLGSAPGGEHVVILTFSGGGTRAAALSYGVLRELRNTRIDSQGRRVRLLDEVDAISSVSGGSFTAAYYGLFGERVFEDYERAFLRQSVQSALIRKLFDPEYWWRSLFTAFDRTEMAVEYYDSQIFRGKTFGDMRRGAAPFVEINATDLGGGQRFSFTQGNFDLICSDLDDFSVARAVTASSAVPVAFPPVVLENHGGSCDNREEWRLRRLDGMKELSSRQRGLDNRLRSYLDRAQRPYIHLIDGGISGNLGLRALLDHLDAAGPGLFIPDPAKPPKDVLVISVNAEVKPDRGIDLSAEKPSVIDTIDAFSSAQIALYNQDTRALMARELREAEAELRRDGHDIRFYLVEVSFGSLREKALKSLFNNLPTSLELPDGEIDLLIGTGGVLLRLSPEYRAFLEANAGKGP